MLEVSDLHAGYRGIKALQGVSLRIEDGEMVALVGSNGAGKSTLLNSICGVVRPTEGRVEFEGRSIVGQPAWRIARGGLLQVPEGRQIVSDMSVLDNLLTGTSALRRRPPAFGLADIYDLFPVLAERRQQMAGSLSGGQQQMLAIGRALMGDPKLLMLDEPSLGIAPRLIGTIFEKIQEINRTQGITVLLVEQNANLALEVSHHAYVLETGRVVMEGVSSTLRDDPQLKATYLGG